MVAVVEGVVHTEPSSVDLCYGEMLTCSHQDAEEYISANAENIRVMLFLSIDKSSD